MKRLLRSVIDFADGKVSKESLNVNYQRLAASRIAWTAPVDEKIYGYVREFFNNNFELPTAVSIGDYFKRANDIEVEERLKDIASSPVYIHKQYANLLDTLLEDERRLRARAVLKTADEILGKGRVIQKGREKVRQHGLKDALAYLAAETLALEPEVSGGKTKDDLRDCTAETLAAYKEAKKGASFGVVTGLNTIDKACRGLKPGELHIHAGFAGEGKTTYALNWAMNAATRYRVNVVYVSLEMPLPQMRRLVHVLHSANKRWSARGKRPLDYARVRDGELAPQEETFLEEVLQDFANNDNYCRFHVWCPDRDVSIADIRTEVRRLHQEFEVGLVVIDHSGLLKLPSTRDDYAVKLNAEIREAKKLALQFDGGRGVPVCLLHQLNREGKKEADKAGGRFELRALSYSNEAEKSADVITASYLNDELRAAEQILVSNLKNRENGLFQPITLSVDWAAKKLFEPSLEARRFGISAEELEESLQGI